MKQMSISVRAHSRVRARPGRLALAALVVFGACGESPTSPNGVVDPNPPPPGVTPYDHARGPGASAQDLLSATDYDSLVVEVHYVEGFRPTDEGLQIMADFLAARLNKPAGIEIRVQPALQIATQATYSTTEIRALEQQYRTAYTSGRTLAAHFLFVGGEYAAQANVLGIAYNNTSMAIFEEKIQEYSGGALEPPTSTVEGVVANHEIGHILGLVDNGSDMQAEHQDEPNGHHCDDPNCLMYYAVRTSDFVANLVGAMPELDPDCVDDLQANGGK